MSADLAALGASWARSAAEDLGGLLGSKVGVDGPTIGSEDRESLGGAAPVCVTRCAAKDESGAAVHLLSSRADVVRLASALMKFDEDRIETLTSGGLDEESLDAYGEVANLAVAALGRVFQEAGLPDLTREETADVADPSGDSSWIEGEGFRVARFRLAMEGQTEVAVAWAVPEALAGEWFGEMAAEAAGESAGVSEDERPIALLDPSEQDRLRFEEREAEFGRPVLTLDSQSFHPEMIEDLADTGAIILSWDLGGRPALDLLESLRGDPRTSGLPIALASPAPTASMVRLALRAGARTFLHKPYEPEEIVRRLLSPEPPGADASPTAEPAEEEAAG